MATEPQISDLVDRSKVVFIGTVLRLGASTVPTYSVTSHTVIVNVNRVFKVISALGDLTRQRITVELTGGPGVVPGQRAIFFVNPLVYADSIVVEEVGRVQITDDSADRQQHIAEVTDAIQRHPDRLVRNRLATADVVVTGKVAFVRKTPRPPNQPRGEHDPDWREAVIDVQAVESGLPMKQIVVLFPGSDDRRWHTAPKFRVGQEGVWILHQHTIPDVPTLGYTALNPSDFHPKPSRNRIRAIIQGRR
jgi:hypothetical protein